MHEFNKFILWKKQIKVFEKYFIRQFFTLWPVFILKIWVKEIFLKSIQFLICSYKFEVDKFCTKYFTLIATVNKFFNTKKIFCWHHNYSLLQNILRKRKCFMQNNFINNTNTSYVLLIDFILVSVICFLIKFIYKIKLSLYKIFYQTVFYTLVIVDLKNTCDLINFVK